MPEWHPIMAAVEGPPGVWRMVDPQGLEYGRIEIRRVDEGRAIAYRAERDGNVLGWATSLRLACWRVHAHMLASLAPAGGAAADWGELTGNARNANARRPPGVTSEEGRRGSGSHEGGAVAVR